MSTPLQIGFLVFPHMTQLDVTGPLQVFSAVPGASVHLIWKNIEPLPSDTALDIMPTITFADCPQLDVLCVPGGSGDDLLLHDEEVLSFLRKQAEGAKYVTSVCSGSLVLGAAGLLKGYRAATYWNSRDRLPLFGVTVSHERVCIDRNRITGGGCTAGIDFALVLVSMLIDRTTAETIQLYLEYDPAPPFNSGSPETASSEVLALVTKRSAPSKAQLFESAKRAADRMI